MTSFRFPDFDYNAGGGVDPRVREEMDRLGPEADTNPHAPHARGRAGRAILENARERIASLFDLRADEIVLCSGGTEANNIALACGVAWARARGRPMAVSRLEHASIAAPARAIAESGAVEVVELPCGEDGRVHGVEDTLAFASCILAQGEVGFVQDLGALRALLEHSTGDLQLHSDASQALGRIDCAPAFEAADLVTLSPHKAGGPRGIGVLWMREAVWSAPALRGGSQELGRRPGTQSPRLAHGAACALECAVAETEQRAKSMHRAVSALLEGVAPLREAGRLRVVGEDLIPRPIEEILPNTRTLCFPGVEARVLLPALDIAGIGVSYGSACSSGALEPSPTLRALGLSKELASSCLRVSFGPCVEVEKIRHAASLLMDILARIPSKSSASSR